MSEHMLSTIDNPSNPFTDFDDWLRFDRDNKHYCLELTASKCFVSDIFSDAQQDEEIEYAIEKIVTDPLYAGIYIRVRPDTKVHPIPIK